MSNSLSIKVFKIFYAFDIAIKQDNLIKDVFIIKILITGGAGFIGSNLTLKLHKENQIVIVDDLSMGKIKNISNLDNVTFHKKSVLDKEFMKNLLINEDFDYIYHLAAIASVADSIERPLQTHEINFSSTLNLLNLLKDMESKNLKRFVFASSAAVYGEGLDLPKKESSKVEPMTPYAIDKYSSEKYTLIFNDLYGIPTSVVRFFNVYGPNQNPESPYSGVISIIVNRFEKKIKQGSACFDLYGDGSQSRDFVYVEDVVQALTLVSKSKDSLGKVYNVGTGLGTDLNSLIENVSDLLNETISIKYLPERIGDIKESYSDISQLSKIGYKANYNIHEGLKKYLRSINLY